MHREYLIGINLVALVLALAILFARRRATGYAPFLFGADGAVAIMMGKFVFASPALAWFGFAVLVVGSVGTIHRGRASRACNSCGNSPANLGE
jgi:hypothetical protein